MTILERLNFLKEKKISICISDEWVTGTLTEIDEREGWITITDRNGREWGAEFYVKIDKIDFIRLKDCDRSLEAFR